MKIKVLERETLIFLGQNLDLQSENLDFKKLWISLGI
jgi:hypothetical protein